MAKPNGVRSDVSSVPYAFGPNNEVGFGNELDYHLIGLAFYQSLCMMGHHLSLGPSNYNKPFMGGIKNKK